MTAVDTSHHARATGPVLVQDRGAVRVITLNRPERRNAVDRATADALEEVLEGYQVDATLRCAVITGSGNVFCAGMDLRAFLRGERPSTARGGFAGLVERVPDKPLVAAVNGPAVAGGFEIVLACDLVVASTEASFALPEVKRGLVAAGGGLLRLPARMPYHLAMELALTGEPVTAIDAARFGLVNRLAPPAEVLSEALALAELVAGNGPLATRATKRIIQEAPGWPVSEAFERQRRISEPVRGSDDAIEGARAFSEKRRPVWQGR